MAGGRRDELRRSGLGALLLVAAVLLVFARVAGYEFLLYDDDKYLTENPVVQQGLSPESLGWALTTFRQGTWQPVTWLSYLTDITLFGFEPGPMHAVNLALHLLASLLLWRVLGRATGRPGAAFVVAFLFALHPLQVQSVAWIAERKGLVAAVLGLAALDQWITWVREPDRGAALRAHAFFALSILAKPVWLPLPLLLLLLDRWPFGRRVGVREKLPMFAIAGAGTVLAAIAQASASALSTLDEVGLIPRVANAVLAWAATLRRLVAPVDLGAFYPFRFDHPWTVVLVWALVLAAGTAVAWRLRERRPAWFTGWVWWLLLQAPTVGLLQYGAQGTADRFSYLPLIGLLVMLVYGIDWPRRTGIVVAAVAIVGAAVASDRVLPRWRDTVSLFEHSIERSGGSALEHQNLAQAYIDRGELRLAMRHSSRALWFAPYTPTVLFKHGDLLFALGNYTEAMENYREGLKFDPARHGAWAQVARLYALERNWEMAARAWYTALDLVPDDVTYVLGLARALGEQGLQQEALVLYQRGLELDPAIPGVRAEIGWIHATSDDPVLRSPEVALRLAETDLQGPDGQNARALEVLAAARAATGDLDEARRLSIEAESRAEALGQDVLAAKIRERRSVYLPETP